MCSSSSSEKDLALFRCGQGIEPQSCNNVGIILEMQTRTLSSSQCLCFVSFVSSRLWVYVIVSRRPRFHPATMNTSIANASTSVSPPSP